MDGARGICGASGTAFISHAGPGGLLLQQLEGVGPHITQEAQYAPSTSAPPYEDRRGRSMATNTTSSQ